ncbi:MAG: MFS transporter [Erysipelotrichaceae bacterium]|nr:MFS transporter [Erysipelotrichaceae bacterium]
MKFPLLENKAFDPKVSEEKVGTAEILLAYLIGPSMTYLLITSVAGNYLLQFYTDVIGVSGLLISAMPLAAKLFSAFTNVMFGKLIDSTNSRQGKARPWILISGILLSVSGILMYAIPRASFRLQVIWIIFSYNLFFAGANNIYLLSHTLMLPRSTRDHKSRDSLSLVKNVSEAMIPGTLSAVIMPLLVRHFGVGPLAQSNWFRFMSLLSIMAIPGTLLEYFFSRERVSEEKKKDPIPFFSQLKDCLKYDKWILIILIFVIKTIDGHLANSSMIYYSNWVLSNSVETGATRQVLLNVIGQFPLGPGILVLMPLVKKYGKTNLMKYGYLLAALGSAIVFFSGNDMRIVLAGLFIKSIGSITGYLSMSLLSDVLDGFEKKFGYRCDTFSITCTTLISMMGAGIAQSILLGGINLFGYVAPSSASEVIVQSDAIRFFFSFLMSGVPLIGFLISYYLLMKLNRKEA